MLEIEKSFSRIVSGLVFLHFLSNHATWNMRFFKNERQFLNSIFFFIKKYVSPYTATTCTPNI